jgi:hypothetical protein
LIWAAIVFGCAQAALGLTVRAGWVAVDDLVYANKAALLEKHSAFRQLESRNLTVLAMGSSRTMCGLHAQRLGVSLSQDLNRPAAAFNFGIPAAGPLTMNLYLRRLLADGVRPSFVLIEVLPPFLAGQLGAPMEARWLQPHRVLGTEFDHLESFGYSLPRAEPLSWQRWLAGTHVYRSALLSRNLPSWVPYEQLCDASNITDAHGWARTPVDRVTPEQYRKGLSIAWKQYHPALTDFEIGGASCIALRDLVELCRRENIPAALLLMPEGADFREWYTADTLTQIDSFLDELRRAFDMPIIDAREWNEGADFADGHHLLPGGAERFTDRIASELPRLANFPRITGGGGP